VRAILAEETTWAESPPGVGDRILADVSDLAATATPTSPVRPRAVAAAIIAAAAVVVLAIGIGSIVSGGDEPVVAMAGTELQPGATGEATLGAAENGWWIRLDLTGLPAAAPGTYYEGWVWDDDGAGVSIGTFHLRGTQEPVVLWSGVDPAEYPSIWVTLEDEDGDPAASERIVMRGRVDD
jgi:hypothetical protein